MRRVDPNQNDEQGDRSWITASDLGALAGGRD